MGNDKTITQLGGNKQWWTNDDIVQSYGDETKIIEFIKYIGAAYPANDSSKKIGVLSNDNENLSDLTNHRCLIFFLIFYLK
tara:strand:+ start:367 stop:609 length:243 start_codon:yes stop_codon:yes gene_type:complete